MDLYSAALGLACGAVGVGALAAVRAWLAARGGASATAARRLARRAAMTGLLLAALAFVHHLLAGHRPGTPEAMNTARFVLEHPALFVAAAGAGAILWWPRPGEAGS